MNFHGELTPPLEPLGLDRISRSVKDPSSPLLVYIFLVTGQFSNHMERPGHDKVYPRKLEFQQLGRREVRADFDTAAINSDVGALLILELDMKFGFLSKLAKCFDDYRDPRFTTRHAEELLAQLSFAIDWGYKDHNDHEQLRCMVISPADSSMPTIRIIAIFRCASFCGSGLLCANSNIDTSIGTVKQLERIISLT